MLRKSVLSLVLVAVLSTASFAASYTWNGGSSAGDLWSDGANWGGTGPANSNLNSLVFDGTTRLTPALDTASPGSFTVNSIAFPVTAGAFVLGGQVPYTFDPTTNVYSLIRLGQGAGMPTPQITKSTASDVIIHNPIYAAAPTSILQVDVGTLTCDGAFLGGNSTTVVKTGPGTAYVNNFAIINSPTIQSNVGPRWQVNDGTLVLGTKVMKFWNSAASTAWTNDTTPSGHYVMVVGDGVGAAQSAVLRYDAAGDQGASKAQTITINSDGWLDINGKGHDMGGGTLTINGGKLTVGNSGSWFVMRETSNLNMTGGSYDTGALGWFYGTANVNTFDAPVTAVISGTTCYLPGGPAVNFNTARSTTAGVDVDLLVSPSFAWSAGINKTGPGVMVTTGNNANTNANTVSGGKLFVNGANTTQGSYTVNYGATLGGKGSIALAAAAGANPAAKVLVNGGGILAPGDVAAPGTLTIGKSTVANTTVTLGDGGASLASLAIRIGSTAADQLVLSTSAASTITSNLILNGATLDLSFLNGFIPANGASYTIVDNQAPAASA